MALAPITHGSRMDHFYAVDATNGLTYIGHCEQTAQTVGQITLIRYCVVHTADLVEKHRAEGKEFGVIANAAYTQAHGKMATVALTAECRVAIHILDEVLRSSTGTGASPTATTGPTPAPPAGGSPVGFAAG
jgi:hypothetical protein